MSEFQTLPEVLADFYLEAGSIRRVAEEAGVALERVDISGPALDIWSRVIDEAFATGKHSGLLQVSMAEYGMNTKLVRAWEIELEQRRNREVQQNIGRVDVNTLLLHKVSELGGQMMLSRAENSAVRHMVNGRVGALVGEVAALDLRLKQFAVERKQATRQLIVWMLLAVAILSPLSSNFLPVALRALADLLS